jgi:pimeloyl-ACP methyl ester carboxylesterase
MELVEGAGVPLAVDVSGDGPDVLLLHGMGQNRHVWTPIPGARTIAYDRRGYGDSGAPEPYRATTVAEQAEDALAVLEALDAGPAIAGASDFAALVVLDLLMRHPDAVGAAVLIDPSAFPLVPTATEALSGEVARLQSDLREDGAAPAIARFRAARGLPDAPPGAPRAFFADLGGQATLELTRHSLGTIDAPVTIIVRASAAAHVRAAATALTDLLPDGRLGVGEDVGAAIAGILR